MTTTFSPIKATNRPSKGMEHRQKKRVGISPRPYKQLPSQA